METQVRKHPGPGGSKIHGNGTDQSIHSGGLGVSMREVTRRKLLLSVDPSQAESVRSWAASHIDRIRRTGNRHESLAGSTIQRLNNLYYTADNIIEDHQKQFLAPKAVKPKRWGHRYGPIVEAVEQGTRRANQIFNKRNIRRTSDFPHGRSIKWPKVYRGLRRRGMSKEKSARISNAMSNKYRGGRRLPLSAKAGKKGIPEDILDKRPDLRKGSPDMSDVHTEGIVGYARAEKKRRKKKKETQVAKSMLTPRARVLQDRFLKHYAPIHDSGTGQEVHDPKTGGGGGDDDGGRKKDGTQSAGQPTGNVTPPSDVEARSPADSSRRPTSLNDFIGQTDLKEQLDIAMDSARARNAQLDHMLFGGPPGLGKTTLANIMAKEMGANLKVVTGPTLRSPGDLMAMLSNIQEGDMLFIDEIHALPVKVQEILYPAMEDFEMDLDLGEKFGSVRVELPNFTLLGATTRPGDLAAPLRDRFGMIAQLDYYTPDELTQLVESSAKKIGVNLDTDAAFALASRSRGTPRVANNLLDWVRDYSHAREGGGQVTRSTVDTALSLAGIDHGGLSKDHRSYLRVLAEAGMPQGSKAVASRLGQDEVNITDAIEPYLIREGYITRTSRGRLLTEKGQTHLEQLTEMGFTKHLQGQHDQKDHGRWARGSSARQISERTLESGEPLSGNRGSSTYVPTGSEPDSGFGVGTPGRGREYASQPSVRAIRDYMRINADLLAQPGYVLGTWESPEGHWWLDVSRVFDTAEEAWAYGPNEEAIFDFGNLESVYNPSLSD